MKSLEFWPTIQMHLKGMTTNTGRIGEEENIYEKKYKYQKGKKRSFSINVGVVVTQFHGKMFFLFASFIQINGLKSFISK